MNYIERELDLALADSEQENRLLKQKVADYEGLIRDLTDALRAQAMPPAPMECKTDAEKIAYAYGWFKALKLNPARKLWVGLTEEDKADIFNRKWWDFEDTFDVDGFLRLTEAKLKEKNT